MKNFQNADFYNNEYPQEITISLCKSAEMLRTKDLILHLNDSLISRKSKEYNFDFANAVSYEANKINSEFSLLSNELYFSPNINETPKEIKLISRKIAADLNKDCEAKNTSNNNLVNNTNNYNNKIYFNNEIKSKQNVGNFSRNPNCQAIKKLKERLKLIQQKKKFELFGEKIQKAEL